MDVPASFDSRQFRNALGSFTTGVTIVTTRDQAGNDVGLTANSFNSVSLDPPMVLWSLAKTSRNMAAFVEGEHFAVHVLSASQEALSNLFAKSGADKFKDMALGRGPGGIPLLDGCSARFQCRTAYRYDGGDHEIFIGEVVAFDHSERAPLAFHAGKYGILLKTAPAAPPVNEDLERDSSFSTDFLAYLLGRAYQQVFLHMRGELEKRGLRVDQYYLLNALARHNKRTIVELDALLSLGGLHVTPELVGELATFGMVSLHQDSAGQPAVHLTESGRQTMIELIVHAKASESHAERELEYGEQQMLKQLLRRVIHATNPGAPLAWKKAQGDV
jgi:3-hydroxy-9,10-secoandrosta-1,3,5(10)-triene-9,17-dione monooxygenase reductase component